MPPKAARESPLSTLSNEAATNLLELSRVAQSQAYAPYSGYKVGAAILAASGKTYVGANIENASYGDTMCAERTAIGAMVMGGDTEIVAIAVVTKDEGYPCGICLQAINEFAPNPKSCQIVVPSKGGFLTRSLHELAPYLWRSDLVSKKANL
ncbi:MAG: cytidine deaminase [Armatimonadetes bacterium]|nr:cytidine deaminase [Armatimonadota bacterium]